MSDPNDNQNSDYTPDNTSYTNLMLFGTANTPGSSGSNPPTRPQQPFQPYNMYPQQPYGYFPNPGFPQQPFPQQPFQPFPQQPFQPFPHHNFPQHNFPQQPFPQQNFQPAEDSDEAPTPTQRSGKSVAPSPQKRSHQKKPEGSKKTCNKRQWGPNEEVWLATCFCDTSEDARTGNSQKRGTLWGTVEEKFNSNSHGWLRGADQLSSKWRSLDRNCKAFNACYESVRRAWGSGQNDSNIYDQAVSEYFDTYAKTFTQKEAWSFLKDHPKWMAPQPVGGTGLRDEGEDFFDQSVHLSADSPNELFGPDPISRPMGRTRARKAARSSGSSDAATSSRGTPGSSARVDEAFETMARKKAELIAARQASIESMTRQDRLRTALQGVQFLQVNPDNIPDPTDRAAVIKMKKKFRNEFREFYDADEDSDE